MNDVTVSWSHSQTVTVHFLGEGEKIPRAFYEFVDAADRLGFDVETGGPDPLDPMSPGFAVRIVGFGSLTEAWVLDASHVGAIRAVLSTDRITFVAHNAPFDTLAVKRSFGVTPANVLDTLAGAVLLYPPDSPDLLDDEHADEVPLDDRHQLKPLTIVLGTRCLVDAEDDLHSHFTEVVGSLRPAGSDQAGSVRAWLGAGFSRVPTDEPRYWTYNGLDAIAGLRLLNWLVGQWERDHGDRTAFLRLLEAESKLGQMLVGVRWRGQRIDKTALREVYTIGKAARNSNRPAFERLGVDNPASPVQVSDALILLGVIDPVLSDSKLISTNKKFGLPRLLEPDQPEAVRELAGELKTWRGHNALVGKIREIDRLLAVYGDGRVHPRVNPLQAKTGRMSISEPALQNLPKKDTRIRSVFIADPGWVIVGADFAQIEYRVAAGLSGDPALVAAVSSGNLHKVTAAAIFGDAFDPETYEDSIEGQAMYGYAKNCGFLTLYGGGPANLVATSGGALSINQAERILGKFNQTYPGLKRWSKRVNSQTEVVSRSGRRTAVDRDRTYANTNYHVQGAARDVFADSLLRLRAAGWADHLWLVIHDEILLHVPVELAEAACEALEAAMCGVWFGVPIEAQAEIRGDRWMPLPEREPAAELVGARE